MLHLVLGRSGSGKSEYILESAVRYAGNGKRVYYLVPSQITFVTEVKVAQRLKGHVGDVQVVDFQELANKIFEKFGKDGGKTLDDMTRCVLMRLACESVKKDLMVYTKQCESLPFIQIALDIVQQFKFNNYEYEQFGQLNNQIQDDTLRCKMHDFTEIYHAYEQLIAKGYHDSLDDLRNAQSLAENNDFFKDTYLLVDGFLNFNKAEEALLKTALLSSDDFMLSLTAEDSFEHSGVFIDQQKTAETFNNYAIENKIKINKVFLKNDLAFCSDGLRMVERMSSSIKYMKPKQMVDERIHLISAGDKYDALRYIAAEIQNVVQTKGVRYNDIVVLCRNQELYTTAIQTVFSEYEIPLFMDQKENVLNRPLVFVAINALEACRGTFKSEKILALSKSPALGIPPELAGELENYCYVWSIKGPDWEKEFTNDPEGFSSRNPDEYQDILAKLNQLRKQLIDPLIKLKKKVTKASVLDFCQGLYEYYLDINATQNLADYYRLNSDLEQIEVSSRIWNAIIDVMDLFSDVIGDKHYSITSFIDLFGQAVASAKLGKIPNTKDSLLFSDVARSRTESPKLVFVLGLNEGEFPAADDNGGVFTDREKEILENCQLNFGPHGVNYSLRERFYLYCALTASKENLYLITYASDLEGEKKVPSSMFKRLKEVFPSSHVELKTISPCFYIHSENTAKNIYATLASKESTVERETIREFLLNHKQDKYLATVSSEYLQQPAEDLSAEEANKLISDQFFVSPTDIEKYFKCPYQYFCEKMLNLKPRRKVEYDPLSTGNIIHYIFEHLFNDKESNKTISDMSDELLLETIQKLIASFISKNVQDLTTIDDKYNFQMGRLSEVMLHIVRHMADSLNAGDFQIYGTEIIIGPNSNVQSPTMESDRGKKINIVGRIDRVDTWFDGLNSYARIIDYKSGLKKFDIEDVLLGINMQMLIYLFCLCDEINQEKIGKQQEAGVLYAPSGLKLGDIAKGNIDSSLKMNGLLLDDIQVLRAMENNLEGRFIPVSVKKDGSYSKEHVIEKDSLNQLKETVFSKVREFANQVENGIVSPKPTIDKSNNNPCLYCSFSDLCNLKSMQLDDDIETEVNA